MNLFTFIAGNPWQTFFLGPFVLALVLVAAVVFVSVIELVFRLINRLLRTIKVCGRGWPPEHLDADGDFRPQPKPVVKRNHGNAQ